MVYDGVENTPSDAMFWAIYNDLQGFATRGAELESGQRNPYILNALMTTMIIL